MTTKKQKFCGVGFFLIVCLSVFLGRSNFATAQFCSADVGGDSSCLNGDVCLLEGNANSGQCGCPTGGKCDNGYTCQSGHCKTTFITPGSVKVGDACKTNPDCVLGNFCTQSGTCQPITKGYTCQTNSDCATVKTGLVCNDLLQCDTLGSGPTITPPPISVTPPNVPTIPGYNPIAVPTGLTPCSDPYLFRLNNQGPCLPKSEFYTGIAGASTLTDLIVQVIKILLTLAGIVSVLFLIVGGFWYMTSAGNEEQAEKGKNTITNFFLGLVIILMAYAIVTIVNNLITQGK